MSVFKKKEAFCLDDDILPAFEHALIRCVATGSTQPARTLVRMIIGSKIDAFTYSQKSNIINRISAMQEGGKVGIAFRLKLGGEERMAITIVSADYDTVVAAANKAIDSIEAIGEKMSGASIIWTTIKPSQAHEIVEVYRGVIADPSEFSPVIH